MSSPGVLGAVAAGYDRASAAGRALAAVLLPVVAAMLLVSPVLDLVPAGARLVIVDGSVLPRAAAGPVWLEVTILALLWTVGLVAGAWTLVRGGGPVAALWEGLKRLPVFAVGLAAFVGSLQLGLRFVAGSGVLTVAVLVLVGLMGIRLLLSGIAWTVEGAARWPSWLHAWAFLLGGVGVPVLVAAGWTWFGAGGVPGLGALLGAGLTIVVLAAQSGLATPEPGHVTLEPGLVTPGPVPRKAWLWTGAALLVGSALVTSGVVALNPFSAPVVRTHDRGPADAVAVAWPAGQHPVIATMSGAWFCDDDLCADFTDVNGGPPAIEGFGTAAIAADGTVIKTAVTGGPANGGPFVQVGRCVRAGCRQAWVPVRADAREKLDRYGEVEVAGAAAPDGAIWLFVAAPVAGEKYRFLLIRCLDVACAAPQRHEVGATARSPQDGYRRGLRARLSVGADGRPVASFWTGRSVLRYSCEPVTCAGPRESATAAAPPDAVWTDAGPGIAAFRQGQLFDGVNSAQIVGEVATPSGAVAVAGPYVYLAGALPSEPDAGFHLTIGEPERYWRQTVWRCRGFACTSLPMDLYRGEGRREVLAVAGDGRVLVVRDDRIALLEKPFA